MTIEATTPHMLGDATLAELEQGLRGQLIRPSDEGYDEARAVWNGAHDRRPALVEGRAARSLDACKTNASSR